MVFNKNTDREWEKYGKDEPYYGVLTDEKYYKSNLTDQLKEEFFTSGYHQIDGVLRKIRKHIEPSFKICKALDFGCGVGRLVIPLAKISEEVTGVDVSESMLKEAQKNCEFYSIKNVTLVKSDDGLSSIKGKFDFIHSFIVFQHIPIKRGEWIFKNLLEHLEDDGVGVFHFTFIS
jgi:2-polyprenyl-3-methyl-5-hydroxy-6-metoxy-1,4-benzoquinol methylase